MHRYTRPVGPALTVLALGLTLLAPGAARAASVYKIQVIVKPGDMARDVPIPSQPGYEFWSALNDSGQILVDVGYFDGTKPELLVQYSGGQFTPIVAGGADSPVGKWPKDVVMAAPFSMNQSGNVAFCAFTPSGSWLPLGAFLWDAKAQTVTPVALKGMPATGNLTFNWAGGFVPAINNSNEIAFPASVRDPAGAANGSGIFFLGRDGKLQPVLLHGQDVPGVGKLSVDLTPELSLNDTGTVAFLARRPRDKQDSAFVWESGTITPMVVVGADVPGGGKIHAVGSVLINNSNRNLVVTASLEGASGRFGLYRLAGGNLTPVAAPDQDTPDGGKFWTLQVIANAGTSPFGNGESVCLGVSAANEAGEHAFLAILEDNSTAAYRMDAAGKLSLILKSGTTTDLGTITQVGSGDAAPNLNSKGQVALTVQLDGGNDTLALLTPTAPQQ